MHCVYIAMLLHHKLLKLWDGEITTVDLRARSGLTVEILDTVGV